MCQFPVKGIGMRFEERTSPLRPYVLDCASAAFPKWMLRTYAHGYTSGHDQVVIHFGAEHIKLSHPLAHSVHPTELYESAEPSDRRMVMFPKAYVDQDGNIINYGRVAVLLGTSLGLEKWELPQEAEQHKEWQWQLPWYLHKH